MESLRLRKTAVIWILTGIVFWFLYQGFARLYERFVPINTTNHIIALIIVVIGLISATLAVRNWVIAARIDC